MLLILLLPPFFILSTAFCTDLLLAYTGDAYREGEVIAEVRQKILSSYVEKVSSEKILKGALRGMMSVLDPYSEYLDEEYCKQIFESTEGEFVGVGIVVSIENGLLTVISPVEDSPAAIAGILAGDKIIAIDDSPAEGINLHDAILKLRGKKGSSVKLTVLHENSKTSQDISVVRGLIQIRSVKKVKIVDQQYGIAYLRLTKFNRHTAKELRAAIKKLMLKKIKSLIIDLRFNPGGLLDAAVDVVDTFISSGIIVYTKGRIPDSYQVFRATAKGSYTKINLVILVNKRTASASEIVSGALQDYHRAIIVGTRTYGKGVVQSILRLRDQKTAIKITTAKYYTPSGRSIQKTKNNKGGVVPDIIVPLTTEQEQELMQYFYRSYQKPTKDFVDYQLRQALLLVKSGTFLRKFK